MAYNNKIRREDEKCADVVSKFLEKHFYNRVENYERVVDRERQLKGVDVMFIWGGKQYICGQPHLPEGRCLSKGYYPLTWHVDKCSY